MTINSVSTLRASINKIVAGRQIEAEGRQR